MDLPILYLMNSRLVIMGKCDMSIVIPQSHNCVVFENIIINYSISTSTCAKAEA